MQYYETYNWVVDIVRDGGAGYVEAAPVQLVRTLHSQVLQKNFLLAAFLQDQIQGHAVHFCC